MQIKIDATPQEVAQLIFRLVDTDFHEFDNGEDDAEQPRFFDTLTSDSK